MEKLYFDYNIISYCRTKTLPKESGKSIGQITVKNIEKIKDIFDIAFSPAHLEDIALSNRSKPEFINDEITFLTKIAKNHSIVSKNMEDVELFCDEYPNDCYKRVIDWYSINKNAENNERIKYNYAHKHTLNLNHVSPEDIFKPRISYREIIINYLCKCGLIKEYEKLDMLRYEFNDIKNKFYIFESYVECATDILEQIGFYREKNKKGKDRIPSRMNDVSHMIYAAYCDIFVSNDKKLLEKTKAVYALLNVPTKIMSLQEFDNYLCEYYKVL